MSKVDWSKAPEGAEFYARGFRKSRKNSGIPWVWTGAYWSDGGYTFAECKKFKCFELRPKQWPESDERIDVIGTNGNEGLHYEPVPTTASDFLSEGLRILSERGKEYGSEGEERSFPQVAQAFTAITGKELLGSDVCLIQLSVKQVRQYAKPRFHHDSAVDGVNYTALQAEELRKERK